MHKRFLACNGGREAGQPRTGAPGAATLLFVIVSLAAVFARIPALLTREAGVVTVQVFGPTVGPAGEHSRIQADERKESPDRDGYCHQEQDDLPPRQLDHLDPRSCADTMPTLPGTAHSKHVLDAHAGPAMTRSEKPDQSSYTESGTGQPTARGSQGRCPS